MKITIDHNTIYSFGRDSYQVYSGNTQLYEVEKSLLFFSRKYVLKDFKHRVKLAEIIGNPYNSRSTAVIKTNHCEFGIKRISHKLYECSPSKTEEIVHQIKIIDKDFIVKLNDKILGKWNYPGLVKFGKEVIIIEIMNNISVFQIVSYAILFDQNRSKIRIGWASDSD